jgi:hypothetical protein
MEVSVELHAPRLSTPEKSPSVPAGYNAESLLQPVWTWWRREKICHHRNRTPVTHAVSIIQLLY